MGRPKRVDLGGYVYHVLNRSNGRAPIFFKNGDYEAFLRIASQALDHVPGMRLLSYCLMPNHWHLVLWPRADGELSDFVHWLRSRTRNVGMPITGTWEPGTCIRADTSRFRSRRTTIIGRFVAMWSVMRSERDWWVGPKNGFGVAWPVVGELPMVRR